MFYSDEIIEEVRSRSDIVDVVSGYLSLQKKGNNYWACCPFHNEDTPSFSVSSAKQMFHCFGCGVSGNVYTFLMKYENYSFPEAVKVLAQRCGVKLPEAEYTEEQKKLVNRKQRLLDLNREAARFFYYQLRSPRGKVGMEYLKKRELSEETMKKFGLGFADMGGQELVRYLRSKGFEDELIHEAGLAVMSEKRGLVSQFWNRVMFPIQDINGKVIGFGGRVMGDGEPKYLNSPETPVFDKRRNLFGMNFARTARTGNLILCEGYMDVISMHQAGFTQAVASLGTAFTPEQARLIKRYTDKVLLAYDSDGAGVKAAIRGIGILREAGLTGKIIHMEPYKDPDEFIKNLGPEEFQKRIDEAENSFFFEIRILERNFDLTDPDGKTKFHREIAKKLLVFTEEVERENYLQAIAAKYFVSPDNLRSLVASYAAQEGGVKPAERPKTVTHQKETPDDKAKRSQRVLLTWLTDYPTLYQKIRKILSPEDFTDELYRKVAEKLFQNIEKGNANPASIISMFDDDKTQNAAAEVFNTALPYISTLQEREQAFHDVLLAVKRNSFEQRRAVLAQEKDGFSRFLQAKKELEDLAKTFISLEEG
ncbi:MAG: DNA primase [Acetatifactor sp.]|nr:DNA primase [Acetatifactor sp.]